MQVRRRAISHCSSLTGLLSRALGTAVAAMPKYDRWGNDLVAHSVPRMLRRRHVLLVLIDGLVSLFDRSEGI